MILIRKIFSVLYAWKYRVILQYISIFEKIYNVNEDINSWLRDFRSWSWGELVFYTSLYLFSLSLSFLSLSLSLFFSLSFSLYISIVPPWATETVLSPLVGGWWGQGIARAFTRCMMKCVYIYIYIYICVCVCVCVCVYIYTYIYTYR